MESTVTPDREVTAANITALILNVSKDRESVMNNDASKFELKMEKNCGKWRDIQNRRQEATFLVTGEVSEDARLGLYGD